jgi:hypothetical protein
VNRLTSSNVAIEKEQEMKVTAPARWRALIEMAAGASATCLASIFLLFFTSLGDDMPDEFKIGLPVACWVIGMWFFFAHRSADCKSVNFKVW